MRILALLCLLAAGSMVVKAEVETEVEASAATITTLVNKAKAECKNPSAQLKSQLYLPNNWMCSRGSRGCSPAWKVPSHITKFIKYSWHNRFNCKRRGCPDSCPNPYPYFITAYDYINNAPNLSTLATLLNLFAAEPEYAPVINSLKGDFGGTILAPVNSAFEDYLEDMVVTPATPGVLPFLFELVTYHVLGESLYLAELKPGSCYPTLYKDLSGDTAEICWGEAGAYDKVLKSAWKGKGKKSYGSRGKWRQWAYYFVDEQENTLPIFCADKWVAGGGVIHTITKVAQPSSLYPSLAAAATKNGLTALAAAVTKAGLLDTLEKTISIVFAPVNEAFAAVLQALGTTLEDIDVTLLTTVLKYHVCAFGDIDARDEAFESAECATLLGESFKLTWTSSAVTYAGGTAKILGIVKTPLSLVVVIDTVMVPPSK